MQVSDPKLLGFDPNRLNRIGELMQRYVDEGKLPGFVTLVARKGQIAYLNRCGWMDVEVKRPYQLNTIFRIFSMTKPIASVALLQLYEKSLFGLHDPIYDFIPAFKETKVYQDGELVDPITPITFQHLLTHTAGFSYGGFDFSGNPVDKLYDEANFDNSECTLAEQIETLATLPLRFQPGTQWHYSVATDVVGRLVEVISGQTLGEFMAENIFQPLGMVDTAFEMDSAKMERLSTLYTITPENPLAVQDVPDKSDWLPPVIAHSGGAGLLSTMHDYYRFAQCLLNKGELNGQRILGRKTVERMRMNQLPPELMPVSYEFSEPFHGLGFGLGVSPIVDISQSGIMGSNGDHGWGGYGETVFWIDPQEELIAINMTQCTPSNFYPIRKLFRTAVYQALID